MSYRARFHSLSEAKWLHQETFLFVTGFVGQDNDFPNKSENVDILKRIQSSA